MEFRRVLFRSHTPLPTFQQLVAWLAQRVARHGLRAVGGKPGGIVPRRSPPARVERGSAIRDTEEREGSVLGRRQGVRVEVGRAEEQASIDVRFLQVLLQ